MEFLKNLFTSVTTIPAEKSRIQPIFLLDAEGKESQLLLFHGTLTESQATTTLFSIPEMKEYQSSGIDIRFSQQQLHRDDSIQTIKKKIIHELGVDKVCYEEMYLFTQSQDTIPIQQAYLAITHDDTEPFTMEKMAQVLMNLGASAEVLQRLKTLDAAKSDPNYSWEDILELGIESVPFYKKNSVGCRFSKQEELLYSANPYDILFQADGQLRELLFKNTAENPLFAMDNQLLFNYITGFSPIYLILFPNIIEYSKLSRIPVGHFIDCYFPHLLQQHVTTEEEFVNKHADLLTATQASIQEKTLAYYDTIDMFYDIYHSRTTEIPYQFRGIKSSHFVLHPLFKTTLPLEQIFKQFHATADMPYIKYNPGARRENLYRLYSETISTKGKKIPTLLKTQVSNLSKITGKSKQLSILVRHVIKDVPIEIVLNLEHNGNVSIQSNHTGEFTFGSRTIAVLSVSDIESIIVDKINPILATINEFMEQTGYRLQLFRSMYDATVEIIHFSYTCSIPYLKKIQLTKLPFLTTIFDIVDAKKLLLRFKRIENFKVMDSVSSRICELYKETDDVGVILSDIMMNYTMTLPEAQEAMIQFLNGHTRVQGKYVNKSMDIVEHPGFSTVFHHSLFDNTFIIDVEGIDGLEYITTISMYLDTILRITQYPAEITDERCSYSAAKKIDPVEISLVETVVAATPIAPRRSVSDFFVDSDDDDDDDVEEGNVGVDDAESEEEEEEPGHDQIEEGIGAKVEEEESPIADMGGVVLEEEDDDDDEDDESPMAEMGGVVLEEEEDEDEDEEDDEEEKDEEKKMKGGMMEESGVANQIEPNSADAEKIAASWTKKKALTNRLKLLEPKIFATKASGDYSGYSRTCDSTMNKQPIILTQEEKDKIDREHPGAYKEALQYGTNKDKPYWYICPRYWCILTNSPLTEEEVKAGKCGGKIIPDKATSIPKGHYIYEFTSDSHRDRKGNYAYHNPGFSDKKTGDGVCLPCCFKNGNTELRKQLRAECSGEETTRQVSAKGKDGKRFISYVISPDKYPIEQDRWGFLPLSVELFLHTNNEFAISNYDKNEIKPNVPTLLRYGVEKSPKYSFIACIADLYAYKQNLETPPTIAEMKQLLTTIITLDSYIRYHNGSLVSTFQGKRTQVDEAILVKYQSTELYKGIDPESEAQRDFFEDTVASFENFLAYLVNTTVAIDHTYLWDMMTTANPKLFSSGINLVIMEIVDNDSTNNIQVLCPTNSYSSVYYDKSRETVLLIKQDQFYEPIYLYENQGDQVVIKKTFLEAQTNAQLKRVLTMIQNVTGKYCAPQSSMPAKYDFKQNIGAAPLFRMLRHLHYRILSQVVNFKGKTVAFIVKKQGDLVYDEEEVVARKAPVHPTFYVPCFPSAQLNELTTVYIESDTIWTSYETTRDALLQLKQEQPSILCQPRFKVIEDELIIGILTETNQFIQVDPPSANRVDDGIDSIEDTNYIAADQEIATRNSVDTERTTFMQNITLENQFFSAFRSTVRILLNNITHNQLRKRMIKVVYDPIYLRNHKLEIVVQLLKKLTHRSVKFIDMTKDLLDSFTSVTSCSSSNSTQDKKYCVISEGKTMTLLLPKQHLLSKEDNEETYFLRIADELIRYKRIQQFMFHTRMYLNMNSIEYSIYENELILMHSLLATYFDDLVLFDMNQYVKQIPYDRAQPVLAQTYMNEVSLVQQYEQVERKEIDTQSVECIVDKRPIIGNDRNLWRIMFPRDAIELIFDTTKFCSFHVIISILQKHIQKTFSIANIKVALWKAYEPYIASYKHKIVHILKRQGKRVMMDRLRKGQVSMEELIMSEDYYITNLDMWVLSTKLSLPIVLFSTMKLASLGLSANWLILGGDQQSAFYFIRSPPSSTTLNEQIPEYHIVAQPYKLSEVKGMKDMAVSAEYVENVQSLEMYLRNYSAGFRVVE